jgi:hypothetical protein
MHKQVIPIANVQAGHLQLPITLYDSDGSRATLKDLGRADIEEVFGYRITDNEGGGHKIQAVNALGVLSDPQLLNELATSNLQILLESDTNPKGSLLKENVTFAIKFALGRGDDLTAVSTDAISNGAWGLLRAGAPTTSSRRMQSLTLNNNVVDKLKLGLVSAYSANPKLSTIKALLNAAMQQLGAIDVSCALYFSLLESIYIQDPNPSEKTYKLSLRVTKKLNKDFDFFVKIKKLYGKRSKVIHGDQKGKVFQQEEYEFLEGLAIESLGMYLQSPEEFHADVLDKLLLG